MTVLSRDKAIVGDERFKITLNKPENHSGMLIKKNKELNKHQ
jgi:hypothetical protein